MWDLFRVALVSLITLHEMSVKDTALALGQKTDVTREHTYRVRPDEREMVVGLTVTSVETCLDTGNDTEVEEHDL
jgi:hypothetical protein